MKKFYLLFFCFSLLFITTLSFGQKRNFNTGLQIIPDVPEQTDFTGTMSINKRTNTAEFIYNERYKVSSGNPEAMAREYLSRNYGLLGLKADLSDLKFFALRETPAGYHVRFQQYYEGYPVYQAVIVVNINRENTVYYVANGYRMAYNKANNFNPSVRISSAQALSTAKNYLQIKGRINLEKTETVVYYNNGTFRLAQMATIVPAEDVHGDWEVMVDASTGEIFRVLDKACTLNSGAETTVNGSGWVYAPDPITRARTTYGQTGFVDGNDADTDSLTAQLRQVTLKNITYDAGTLKYTLKSNYAEIQDFESPYTGLHQLDSSNFFFKRANDMFEAVNTFYTISSILEWYNDSLNITIHPFQYTTGVRFDPHGLSGDDNSHYIPSTGQLAFGDGGVDDAEDPFVVVHELGHGLHDWATAGGLSQVQGLSEGCGDYSGMSYERSFGCLEPTHPSYNYAFNWDGHNPFWPGRITNYTAHWPEGLTGTIHTDGQMWASTLMTIYDQIGRRACDKDFITALSMLNASSNQRDAALAFIAADQQLYGGSHLQVIMDAFIARGYVTGAVTADFTADVTGGPAPLTVHFTDMSTGVNPITSWQWDFNNDGVIDATSQNPSFTYNASGMYTVKLTVSDGTNQNTKTKDNYISVNSGSLVFEGVANGTDYSGTYIKNYLQTHDYEVAYTTTFPSSLAGYDAVFLSCGNYSGTYTVLDNTMAAALQTYLQGGGNVYLESGDALGWDQRTNTVLLGLFGLASAADGSTQVVTALTGAAGMVTEGMLFTSSTQVSNGYIDKYTPGGTGALAFTNGSYGNVAVQNFGSFNQKTFCFSYALAPLVDAAPPSTKDNFLSKLVNFFGLQPVPVELTNFAASIDNGAVTLNWETATEKNNSGFAVERMLKGKDNNFTVVTFIPGKGTTTSRNSYSFIDKPAAGVYVYRLRQTDFDGTISYSKEVEVDLISPQVYSLAQNYPNPFNPSTLISYSIAKDGMVSLSVFNLLGEKVAELVNGMTKAGKYEVSFDASGLPSGMYIYRLDTEGYTSVRKMMLTK